MAAPVVDTIKRGNADGSVVGTVSREGLWLAQTPQVFRRDWLLSAYAQRASLGSGVTDDAQLIEAVGHRVFLVPSNATNLKVTTPDDFALANAILQARMSSSFKKSDS